MLVRLEVAHQKANVKKVVLKSDTVIGRSADCNLRIASNEISRRHCRLSVSDNGVFVRDLGSSNGTFIDGNRIEPNIDVSLQPESELSLGGIRFVIRYKPPVTAPVSEDPGSTVDLPFVMSDVPPAEDEDNIAVDEDNETADSPRAAFDDQTILEDGPIPAVRFESRDAGDDTIHESQFPLMDDGDTVQTAREEPAIPEPRLEPDRSPDTVNQLSNAAAEDTIDMRADELEGLIAPESVPDVPPVVDSQSVADSQSATADADRGEKPPGKSWSLFGMFKRKKNDNNAEVAEQPESVEVPRPNIVPPQNDDSPVSVPVAPAPVAASAAPQHLDETIVEAVLPAAGESPELNLDKVDEENSAETISDGADSVQIGDVQVGTSQDDTPQVGEAQVDDATVNMGDDDEALGDFLRNLK